MGSYFDLLPEELIFIIFKISKEYSSLRGISEYTELCYKKLYDMISTGCINPNEYFQNVFIDDETINTFPFIMYDNEGTKYLINNDIIDYIDMYKILECIDIKNSDNKYLYDKINSESGYILFIYRIYINTNEMDIFKELSIPVRLGYNYILMNSYWNITHNVPNIVIKDNWKDFWNKSLRPHHRMMILAKNGII